MQVNLTLMLNFLAIFSPFSLIFCDADLNETHEDEFSRNSTEVWEIIVAEVNSSKIRENLKFLSRHPHMAGTVHDDRLADWIAEEWTTHGLDLVRRSSYRALLSFPNPEKPNKVELLDIEGSVDYTSSSAETPLRPEDDHPDFVHSFNAFAPNGTVQGALVYANYGSKEDFEALERLGVNVSGKIIIAKYGAVYRGNKVQLAWENGAVGVILFSDPLDYAQGAPYPNGVWLSGSGMQRGSIKLTKGDSLTPQYPSIDGALRIPLHSADLPRIPCQPIGYDDAAHFLNLTSGQAVPAHWTAAHLTKARTVGHEDAAEDNREVRLTVNNYLKEANVTNIIGIIRGSSEPDRYVIAGNHRDAWGFGAVDASGGTAQMMEVTRVLGRLLQTGWRPERTIVFCSWGGEEMGLIGSTEWVEENYVKLTRRAIAYVNTDVCAYGERFSPAANPFLHHFLNDVTRQVPSPVNKSRTLHDDWAASRGRSDDQLDQTIEVPLPGGGTDHVPFAFFAGIPSVDLTFDIDPAQLEVPISMYPAYHTGIDTFHLVDTFGDPGFHRHRACAQLNGLMLQKLADAALLPFNLTHYAQVLQDAAAALKRTSLYAQLMDRGIKIDKLDSMITRFKEAADQWQQRFENLDNNDTFSDPLLLRAMNDQLAHLEQAFLLPEGLPYQKSYRHMLFSLSLHNFYGSNAFPGLLDLAHAATLPTPQDDDVWSTIQRHVSQLVLAMHAAIATLREPHFI